MFRKDDNNSVVTRPLRWFRALHQSNSRTSLDPATLMACEILFKKQLPRDFSHCDLLPNEGKVRGAAEMVQVAARGIGTPNHGAI